MRKTIQKITKFLAKRCGLIALPYETSLNYTKMASIYIQEAGLFDKSQPYKAGFLDGQAHQLNNLSQEIYELAHN